MCNLQLTQNMSKMLNELDIVGLSDFLKKNNNILQLDEEDICTLKINKISGARFLLLKKDDLINMGLKMGPVVSLYKFISDIKKGKVYFYYLFPYFHCINNYLFVL